MLQEYSYRLLNFARRHFLYKQRFPDTILFIKSIVNRNFNRNSTILRTYIFCYFCKVLIMRICYPELPDMIFHKFFNIQSTKVGQLLITAYSSFGSHRHISKGSVYKTLRFINIPKSTIIRNTIFKLCSIGTTNNLYCNFRSRE